MSKKEISGVDKARAALKEAEAKQGAAKVALEAATKEMQDAWVALRQSMEEADASLPSCKSVTVNRYGGRAEEPASRLVLLRKTPSGLIVARRFGDHDMKPVYFEYVPHIEAYRCKEKASWSRNDWRLRDVPAEFLPVKEAA